MNLIRTNVIVDCFYIISEKKDCAFSNFKSDFLIEIIKNSIKKSRDILILNNIYPRTESIIQVDLTFKFNGKIMFIFLFKNLTLDFNLLFKKLKNEFIIE
jgi:hypothetical protein